jgi:hypothetical protein
MTLSLVRHDPPQLVAVEQPRLLHELGSLPF